MDNPATENGCGRPPQSEDKIELNQLLQGLKKDKLGGLQLGNDGVMRSFDADRNIIDAVGLSERQIEIWFERMPASLRPVFKEEQYQGVDGTNVPRKKMMEWDKKDMPAPMSKEEQERRRGIAAQDKE
jgi:hypothetical protein